MRQNIHSNKKLAVLVALLAIILAFLIWPNSEHNSKDDVQKFSASSTNASMDIWDGCKIDPKSNLLTELRIEGSIKGTLSTAKSVTLLILGSDSAKNLVLVAQGPSDIHSSQVQLTMFPTTDPGQANVISLPLINREFSIQLQFSRESGRFSIGAKPNVIEIPFILSEELDCSLVKFSSTTVELPSYFETQQDALFAEELSVFFSQISSASVDSRFATTAFRSLLTFVSILGALIFTRSLRKKRFSLPSNEKFLSIITIQLAAAIPIMWVLAGFFNIDVFGSYVYKSDDGWCRSTIEGIGDHCFGDWNERITPNFYDFQYPSFSSALETSPLGPLWTGLLNYLGRITSPKNLLYFSIVLGIVLGFLTIRILINSTLPRQILVFFVVLVGGYPWLVAVDRLHLSLFLLPFFALVVRSSIQNNRVVLGRSILILALFKPHFALLLLVFANSREWKFFLRYSALTVTSVLTLIALPAPIPVIRIQQYILNVLYMSDYRPSGSTSYPPNISIRRILEILLSFSDLNVNQLMLISITISSVAILLSIILRHQSYFHSLLQIMPLVILGFNGYVATYYLLFSSVILLSVLSSSVDLRSAIENSLGSSRVAVTLFVTAIVVSQSLVIIPYGRTQWGGVLTFTPLIAACCWVALSLSTLSEQTFHYFKLRIKESTH